MILTTVAVCFCFMNVLAIQPLEDGRGNNLPLLPLPTVPSEPINQQNQKKEEEIMLKEKVEPERKEEELKEDGLVKEKALSPSNSTISESSDPVGWLFNFLGYTNNSTDLSQQSDSGTKTVGTSETKGDQKTMLENKLSDTKIGVALENESFPKHSGGKHRSVSDRAGGLEPKTVFTPPQATVLSNGENSQTFDEDAIKGDGKNRSCELNSYGSVCTYVLLTSSTLYFHHVLQTF